MAHSRRGMNWTGAAHWLAVEFGFPIYQKLNGPQMETDWRAIVGYQKAF